jgi:hypothetical protein
MAMESEALAMEPKAAEGDGKEEETGVLPLVSSPWKLETGAVTILTTMLTA